MEEKNEEKMSETVTETEQLRQALATYQTMELISNQKNFNMYLIQEISKLKDAINQIGLILSDIVESSSIVEEQEEAQEEPEEVPEEKPKAKVVTPPAIKKMLAEEEPKKKPSFFKRITGSTEQAIKDVDID